MILCDSSMGHLIIYVSCSLWFMSLTSNTAFYECEHFGESLQAALCSTSKKCHCAQQHFQCPKQITEGTFNPYQGNIMQESVLRQSFGYRKCLFGAVALLGNASKGVHHYIHKYTKRLCFNLVFLIQYFPSCISHLVFHETIFEDKLLFW